jgi:hypothetical protein
MPNPISNAIRKIKELHNRDILFDNTALGGARKDDTSNRILSYSRTPRPLKVYNFASYGSRNTVGGAGNFHLPACTVRLTLEGLPLNINLRRNSQIAHPRKPPSSYFYTIDNGFRNIVQFTAGAIWFLYDLTDSVNPDEDFLAIYQACYGLLSQTPLPTLDVKDDGDNPTTSLRERVNQIRQQQLRGESFLTTAPEPVVPEPPGKGTLWDTMSEPVKVSERKLDLDPLINHLNKIQLSKIKRDTQRIELKLGDLQLVYKEALRKLQEAASEIELNQAQLIAYRNRLQDLGKPDELLLGQLKATVSNYYEAVWEENGTYKALTKPVIMEEAYVMKADVGQFLVTFEGTRVNYQRADGRICLKTDIGSKAIAPHHNGRSICWGIYGDQIREMERKGDLAQILLLTYHHLCAVNPEDCYVHLHNYCDSLGIKRKIDYVAGQTDWPEEPKPIPQIPVPPPEPPAPPAPVIQEVPFDTNTRAAVQVEIDRMRSTNGAQSSPFQGSGRPLTPEELQILGLTPQEISDYNYDPETELEQEEF